MRKLLIAAVAAVALTACGNVGSARIEPSQIKFYDVRDGEVRLRCAFFTGDGEGSGSVFCYKVEG